MKNRIKLILAAVGVLTNIAAPMPCFALDETDRPKLMRTAEDTLDKMVAEVSGFDMDANAQDTVDAAKLSIALNKTLDDLKKVQGNDAQAKKMASEWPPHIKSFQAAVVRLAKMKNLQINLKAVAPKACQDEQKALDAAIKAYLPSKDPDGMIEIPKVGRNVGAKASATIFNAKGTMKMADVTLGEINGFGASGDWSALSAAVKASAKAMHRNISDLHKQVGEECTQLAKGDKNPAVIDARKKIADATGSALAALQVMVDKWEEKAAGFFKTDCAAMQRMADAYCGVDAGDGDGKSEVDRLSSEVTRIVNEVKQANKDLADELAEIKKQADEMAKEAEIKDDVKKIAKEMDDELKKIARLQRDGAMAGFRHPSVQFYIKFGKQMHDRMEASYSCDVRDTPYPGSSTRPDCIRAKGCMIFEFKPDSSGAKSKGANQLRGYKGLVESYYNKVLAGKEKVSSRLGGPAIMQAFDKAGCIKGGTIKLGTKLATYNRCKMNYECAK